MFSLRLLTSFSAALPSPLSESSSSRCYRPLRPVASVSMKADSVVDREEFKRGIATLMQDDGEIRRRRGDFVATDDGNGDDEGEEDGISRIQVPRQKYIHVSKSDLLDGIVSTLFDSGDVDADIFLLLSSCLDSILHAEYKGILEQMRGDYFSTQSMENDEGHEKTSKSERETDMNEVAMDGENLQLPPEDGLDYWFWGLLTSATNNGKMRPEKSDTVASRFQRSFMRLLHDAGFEELSARDLALTSALNSDYLLTLPIYVDWKKASKSNAIIFRRGYATERQKGLLIVEKLDYIQSVLLQGVFFTISKPLANVGKWISEAFREASQTEEVQEWIKRKRVWLKELSLFQQSYFERKTSDDFLRVEEPSESALPIWLAAQKAVSRYEGLLSPVGPREKLFRKLLGWIGIMPPTSDTTFQLKDDSEASDLYLRPIFLSRMTLSDIWRPASKKVCGNDIWKRIKRSISILLSPSTLQEPAFQELILLYTKDVGEKDERNEGEAQSLQLKIYENIPLPDLPVVFPHKKLYFRIIDTVRLDVATIAGLLAFFINYKFENISSSPSALLLDVIAISALIIYASRVVLGYKQTWDRYQLLVNKTLYEKTLASGFGSVHFLLDASEQQQYKEAILTYAVLLKSGKNQFIHHQEVRDKCERFMYTVFKAKVEIRVDEAINTLTRLGLVKETPPVDGNIGVQAVPCAEAYVALKDRWNTLLGR